MVAMTFLLSRVGAEGDTKDFIKKFNTYNEVCRGLGYKGRNCSGSDEGIIAFHAIMSSSRKNLGANVPVIFGKITENAASSYDGTTGKFTATQDGIYSFTWTILTSPGKRFDTTIVLNDNVVGYNYANGRDGSQHYASGSASAIIRMKKHDKVWIRTHGKGEIVHDAWSSFSGFKL